MDEREKINNALDLYSALWKMKNDAQEVEYETDRLMTVLAGTTAMLLGFTQKAATDDFINEQIRIVMNSAGMTNDKKIKKLAELMDGLRPEWR